MFSAIKSRLVGSHFTLPDNWMVLVNPDAFMNRPIKYLEIGAHCGANVVCVAASYGLHPESKLFAIDPWEDYEEYPEYKSSQLKIQDAFLKNIEMIPYVNERLQYFKGYSDKVIQTFPNEYFDMIYVDGNHQPEYVLEDGVLSFRKLKKEGILIFDDYNYGGLDMTKRGVDAFLTAYRDRIKYLGFFGGQIFIQKL